MGRHRVFHKGPPLYTRLLSEQVDWGVMPYLVTTRERIQSLATVDWDLRLDIADVGMAPNYAWHFALRPFPRYIDLDERVSKVEERSDEEDTHDGRGGRAKV